MAADANSDVLIAMNRPAMLADNFMGLSVFRLVTARPHSMKALPNGEGRPTDVATHLLCLPRQLAYRNGPTYSFRGIAVIGFDVRHLPTNKPRYGFQKPRQYCDQPTYDGEVSARWLS
jgi:hypothetical protein